jgi:hypothetical protein
MDFGKENKIWDMVITLETIEVKGPTQNFYML